MDRLRTFLKKILISFGYRLEKVPLDFDTGFLALHDQVRDFTMTSLERQYALDQAVRYVVNNHIEGDIVECGVWRGGSTMLVALELIKQREHNRTLYLYDTFSGMSEPTDKDVNINGKTARPKWDSLLLDKGNAWDYAALSDVQTNVLSTGYPIERILFVEGKVEDTIPGTMPAKIAILRLDTDWYESTRHELEYLFPRLVPGGVLIVDDYGHWKGARQAVDEYFAKHRVKMLLNRIDYTGRIGIK